MIRKALSAVAATALLAVGTAGCSGGTAGDAGGSGDGGGKITLQDANGTVELAAPAKKVVVLEWSYVEDVLALGVKPVGVADIKSYHVWVTSTDKIPGDVTDVGTRQEPSVEKIRALKPDLIIAETDRATQNLQQLKDIAPTLVFTPTTQPQLDTMKKNFRTIAKALDKEAKADEVLDAFDKKATDVKDRLAKAGKAGTPVVIAMGFTSKDAPAMRLHTDDAMVAQVLQLAGLKNAWTGKGDEWGISTVGVEALTQVSSATFLYVATADDNIFTGALANNPVWKNLAFVKEQRVHALDPGTWYYGGPLSATQLLDETAKALKV